MTVKVQRNGKEVEVYKESKYTETFNEDSINMINEAEEEAKDFEEEMKAQMEIERIKVEEPEKYKELIKQQKNDSFKSKLLILWFIFTIGLMILFSILKQGALVVCIVGHYFAIFGLLALFSEGKKTKFKEELPIVLFMLIGLSLMIISLLYQFGIIKF